MSRPKLIIIKEGIVGSIVTDLVSAGTLLGLIGIGMWLDSAALQWFGGALAMLHILGRASHIGTRFNSVTAAREYLATLEKDGA